MKPAEKQSISGEKRRTDMAFKIIWIPINIGFFFSLSNYEFWAKLACCFSILPGQQDLRRDGDNFHTNETPSDISIHFFACYNSILAFQGEGKSSTCFWKVTLHIKLTNSVLHNEFNVSVVFSFKQKAPMFQRQYAWVAHIVNGVYTLKQCCKKKNELLSTGLVQLCSLLNANKILTHS